MSLPRGRWLQFLFMPLALAVIVVAWFNPAVAWFMHAVAPDRVVTVPSPLWMLSVILASTFVTRYVLTRRVAHPRLLIVSAGFAAMLATALIAYRGPSLAHYFSDLLDWGNALSPEFVVLIAGAALWWRGILIGRSTSLVEENLERTFFNGIIALAVLLYFNHLTNWLSTSDLLIAVLTFFAASLAALMIVNIERARLLRSDPGFQLNRQWLGTLVGVIGAILLGAVALAGIFSPDTLREFGNGLRPVISAIGGVLFSVLIFIVNIIWQLMEPLVPIIKALIQGIFDLLERLLKWFDSIGIIIDPSSLRSIQNFLQSPGFQVAVRGVLTAVVLIAFLIAVVWALYKSGLLSRHNFEETHESIASRDLLLDQLKHLLKRLRRKKMADRGAYLPLAGDDPRQAVRRIYQEFLEWARVRVRPRLPSQTPSLYAERLGNLSSNQREPVSQLTNIYLHARYANDPLTFADVDAAQSALTRLQETPVIQSPLTED